MKPLRGRMDEDGRIFDPKTGDYTYRIEKDGEVRDLKSDNCVGHIEKDGRFWNTKENKYTLKIDSDGRIWDEKKGGCYFLFPDTIERYKPPTEEKFSTFPSELVAPFAVPFLMFFVFIVLFGFFLHCLDVEYEKIETGINKRWPSFETRAEKSQKIEAEERRIYASLKKWSAEWVQKNRSRLEDIDYYNAQSIKSLARLYIEDGNIFAKDIWAIVAIPCCEKSLKNDPLAFRSQEFILRSQDNGQSWEPKWKRPHNIPSTVILKGIKVLDEQRACAMLHVTGDPHDFNKFYFAMLYTIDGGETWQIEDKWNPRKIKKLRPLE